MAAVATFWWFPDEQEPFLNYLGESDHVVALPFGAFGDKAEIQTQPVSALVGSNNPRQVLLCLAEQTSQVRLVNAPPGPSGKSFRISLVDSCVIAYDRAVFIGANKLAASNLAAYWEYPNATKAEMIDKPEGFVNWAKKVFQWVYKVTPEWHQYKTYRISKRVKQAIKEGKLELEVY
jgi:hypothetical protein